MDEFLSNSTSLSDSSVFFNVSTAGYESDNKTSTTTATSVRRVFPWANPENVMTKETADDIVEALQCYIFPIVAIIGIIGSILSLLVMFQKKLRSATTSIVLIGLAFSDLLFLVTNMIRKSSCIVKRYNEPLADEISATTFFYMFYLKTSFSRVSTLLVVLISIERLIAVAFPLNVKTIVTKGRMVAAVIFCYIVTFGSLAALPPQYTYTYIGGKPYISMTKFALENADSLKAYNEFFLPIVFRYIPVLMVLIINIIILSIIKGSKRFRENITKQDPKRKEEQRKITRMLVSVSIIFLVCLLPGDVLLFSSTVMDGFQFFGIYHNLFTVLSDLCLLFEMVNPSANFITYMLLNRNFYNTYVSLFCGCGIGICRRLQTDSDTRTKSLKTASTSASTDPQKIKSEMSEDSPSTDGKKRPEGFDNNAFVE